jgi:hypothetical protein
MFADREPTPGEDVAACLHSIFDCPGCVGGGGGGVEEASAVEKEISVAWFTFNCHRAH